MEENRIFLNVWRKVDGGLMLYGGSEIFPLTRHVLAVPWWKVI
jgi:hypothetical protein